MAGVKGRSGGQNAKTVQQHALQGTFQKVRHAKIRNPEPVSGIPVSPKTLKGDASAEWKRMLERLIDCKTLAKVDGGALYQYCRLFEETEALSVRQAEVSASVEILEENLRDLHDGDLVAAFQEIGKMRALEFKYTGQIRQGRMAQRVYLVEFGLTPASRGRVKLPEAPDAKDPFGDFDEPVTH